MVFKPEASLKFPMNFQANLDSVSVFALWHSKTQTIPTKVLRWKWCLANSLIMEEIKPEKNFYGIHLEMKPSSQSIKLLFTASSAHWFFFFLLSLSKEIHSNKKTPNRASVTLKEKTTSSNVNPFKTSSFTKYAPPSCENMEEESKVRDVVHII